jgi:hypothetical protein
MIRKPVLIGVAALALALAGGAAHAMPIAPPAVPAQSAPVLDEEGATIEPARAHGRREFRARRGARGHRFAHRRAFRDRRFRHRPVIVERRRDRTGPFIAGLALGAFTGALLPRLAHPHPYGYPRARYVGTCPPWSQAWYNYCTARYRTFNPHTGYFFARPGVQRFCHCPY